MRRASLLTPNNRFPSVFGGWETNKTAQLVSRAQASQSAMNPLTSPRSFSFDANTAARGSSTSKQAAVSSAYSLSRLPALVISARVLMCRLPPVPGAHRGPSEAISR